LADTAQPSRIRLSARESLSASLRMPRSRRQEPGFYPGEAGASPRNSVRIAPAVAPSVPPSPDARLLSGNILPWLFKLPDRRSRGVSDRNWLAKAANRIVMEQFADLWHGLTRLQGGKSLN
jgi:hypothetical protein